MALGPTTNWFTFTVYEKCSCPGLQNRLDQYEKGIGGSGLEYLV